MPKTTARIMPALDAILQHLLAKPQQFDFFQAVRLVSQKISSGALSGHTDGGENIRFRTTASLRFPVSPIDQVKLHYLENTATWEFEFHVSFIGLSGACGLLPNHYTELLLQRLQEKDSALLEFFDLFNHRIVSLFYRAWQKNRFYINYEQAQQRPGESGDRFTHMLRCLTGNGTKKISAQSFTPDEVRVFYAGYFADQHRPAWSLQSILSDYFEIPVTVKQFQDKCLFLSPKDRTRLSVALTHYHQLGVNAVLGSRAWDCQHHFRLALGPLSYCQFRQFLPGEIKLKALVELTRNYVGNGMTFDICLMLKAQDIPECKIGVKHEIALGRNAWIKGGRLQKYREDTVITINHQPKRTKF